MAENSSEIRVECYTGIWERRHRAVSFWGELRIEVAKILDRWLAPEHCYFKLRGMTPPSIPSVTTPAAGSGS